MKKKRPTQRRIADILRVDVSTVNKVLNRKVGPKFKRATIRRVFRTAQEVGYDMRRPNKAALLRALREVVPHYLEDRALARILRLEVRRVREIRELMRRAE